MVVVVFILRVIVGLPLMLLWLVFGASIPFLWASDALENLHERLKYERRKADQGTDAGSLA